MKLNWLKHRFVISRIAGSSPVVRPILKKIKKVLDFSTKIINNKKMKIKIGDTIKISKNLNDELKRLGFAPDSLERTCNLAGKEAYVHNIWKDSVSKQEYATVDLCVEIPIQCCKKI